MSKSLGSRVASRFFFLRLLGYICLIFWEIEFCCWWATLWRQSGFLWVFVSRGYGADLVSMGICLEGLIDWLVGWIQ